MSKGFFVKKMNRTCIIYAFSSINDNVKFFFHRHLTLFPEVDVYAIHNKRELHDVKYPMHGSNLRIVTRENKGLDFGAYEHGLTLVDRDRYDYFIFINDTVRGPLCDDFLLKLTSKINDNTKLSGITINCADFYNLDATKNAHVQSFCFCTDRIGVSLAEDIFKLKPISKTDIIYKQEIGLSRHFIKNGYNIASLMPEYQNYDFRDFEFLKANPTYGDLHNNSYFSRNAKPYDFCFIKSNRRIEASSLVPISYSNPASEQEITFLQIIKTYAPSAWCGHFEFAMWLVKRFNPKIVVELGVDFANSTFCWTYGNKGRVYGIDCFEGDNLTGERNTFNVVMETYQKLIDRKLLEDKLTIIKGFFTPTSKIFKEQYTKTPIDILHIDGIHTYEAVSEDYNMWKDKCHEDTIFVFHDIVAFADVKRFFSELPMYKFGFVHSAGLGIACKNANIINIIQQEWVDKLVELDNNFYLNIENGLKIKRNF